MVLIGRLGKYRPGQVRARLVVLATFIMLVLGLGIAATSPASAGTDDYPTSIAGCHYVSDPTGSAFTCDLKDSTHDTLIDPWGEYNRECTSFVAWRLSSRNGFTMPFHDNAYAWGSDAQNMGYTVNMTPAVGAVAWWNKSTSMPNGHVAWVESISGSNVTVEEYNDEDAADNYTPYVYSEDTIAASAPSGYIHFKDLSSSSYQPFTGDFNHDGYADIGLRDTATGTIYIRYNLLGSSGTLSFGSPAQVTWAAGSNYEVFTGDFNGDGYTDIGLYDTSTGDFYIEYNLTGVNGYLSFGSPAEFTWAAGSNYRVFAADFNNDGYADIGLEDTNTGNFYVEYNLLPTNGSLSFGSSAQISWQAAGMNYQPFAADFNHDGYADIGLRDANTGTFYFRYNLLPVNGTLSFGSNATTSWAAGSNYQAFAADFNGDGYADIGLRDANTGSFYIEYNLLPVNGSLSFGSSAEIPWDLTG